MASTDLSDVNNYKSLINSAARSLCVDAGVIAGKKTLSPYFWSVISLFWIHFYPRRTHKFGPNNCLTNNFLHCEFKLTMLNSAKVSFGGHFEGLHPWRTSKCGQNNCLTYNFQNCEFQLSMLSSSKVSFGESFSGRTPNLVKIITTSYIVSFNFLREVVQNRPFSVHILREAF